MLTATLFGLSACQADHTRARLQQYPPIFKVNCSDWHKTPSGSWVADTNGTLTYPKNLGLLADVEATPGRHGGNIDIWQFVELSCGPRPMPGYCLESQDINQTRLAEVARMLQPMTKGVGVVLDHIERLPFDMQSCPFSMIGLASESAKGISDAKLRAFVIRMHQAKARLLVRLAAGESPQRWRSLGIDLTTLA